MSPCGHTSLNFDCSEHARDAGYRRPTSKQRHAAAQHSSSRSKVIPSTVQPSSFPAPLILPGDELSWDPTYPAQPFKEWVNASYRNKVTPARHTIYLVPYPSVSSTLPHVSDWSIPVSQPRRKTTEKILQPSITLVESYLRAFYHPLPVKVLSDPPLQFVPWMDSPDSISTPSTKPKEESLRKTIAISTGSEAIRIRARPPNDKIYPSQLNLNDLLDVALTILPDDAYALLMLVEHDLYEDDEDDFCCGRAYGGSRVAVVSTARYNPLLDAVQGIETEHAWPASHCSAYINECCSSTTSAAPPAKKQRSSSAAQTSRSVPSSHDPVSSKALSSAVRALTCSASSPATVFLSRTLKTASHELGHCFGLDHCVYYACIMQGTAGLGEDARQPPYLCPVCAAKVLWATGGESEVHRYRREKKRYEALGKFCAEMDAIDKVKETPSKKHNAVSSRSSMFAAFGAWLKFRIAEVDEGFEGV